MTTPREQRGAGRLVRAGRSVDPATEMTEVRFDTPEDDAPHDGCLLHPGRRLRPLDHFRESQNDTTGRGPGTTLFADIRPDTPAQHGFVGRLRRERCGDD